MLLRTTECGSCKVGDVGDFFFQSKLVGLKLCPSIKIDTWLRGRSRWEDTIDSMKIVSAIVTDKYEAKRLPMNVQKIKRRIPW